MKVTELRHKHKAVRWALQCLLVFIIMWVFLYSVGLEQKNALITAIGTTSIGSSAFLAFVAHNSFMANNKRLIGGYVIAIFVGCALHYLSEYLIGLHWSMIDPAHISWTIAAFATALSMMIMTITDYTHAPAAGMSLGLVLKYWGYSALFTVIIAVAILAILKTILRPWLMNLCNGNCESIMNE